MSWKDSAALSAGLPTSHGTSGHFYARACAAAGIPIERAAKDMDPAGIATMYKHYLHLFTDSYTDDMDRLDAVAARPAIARIGG